MAKILKENLNTKAYTALKQMIARYSFKPGERINVEQITKELGVSRTPVWEAVRRLEQEGLVVNVPNRGVFMYALTLQEALDLIAVRETLEGMAARLAAEHIDDKTLSKLEKILERQRKIVERQDLSAYAQTDADFHELIYESTGNSVLSEMLRTIHHKIRPISLNSSNFIQNFYEDHIGMVAALKAHDSQRAEEVFRRHTQDIMSIIRGREMTFIRPGH
ncbi:MAG TPA: GntR family transcriptional regulator [Spirochaetia bacterium]|nr:GntR family transcriptional regulator [Spirochaetia bacterium]